MKNNFLIGFIFCCVLFLCVAAQRVQDTDILISGGFGGEPKLKANQPDQTANWIEFNNFSLPSSGIVPVTYGGTGTNSIAGLQTLLTITGNTITFTNAAGSAFKLIVNNTTNGFTFVAQ